MEIKFRGKRVDNGEWVTGCYAEFVNYIDGDAKPGIQVTEQVPSGFDRFIPAWETELVEVIPETVGQYTGLKDSNGKMIFEGDIVYLSGVGSVEMEYPFIDLFNACAECDIGEICGNVHDNPELLEGDARE